MDCLFCKIASGQIPSLKIHEDDSFVAFLDINPRAKGHCLVVPKEHFPTLSDIPDKKTGELLETVKKVAVKISEKLSASGYNIFINNGKSAGQVIPHIHIHILPRYDDRSEDSGMPMEAAFPVRENLRQNLKEIQEKIKEEEAKYYREPLSW